MALSKIAYHLSLLSNTEWEQFGNYLLGSASEKDQILARLLGILKGGEPEDEQLYRELYPERDFSKKQMQNLKSQLFARLKDFLTAEELNRSGQGPLLFICSLSRLGAEKYFATAEREAIRFYETQALTLENKRLELELSLEGEKFRLKMGGRQKPDLSSLMDRTEELFVAKILFLALARASAERVLGSPFLPPQQRLWPSILEQLQQGAWQDSPLIQVYFVLYQLTVQPGTLQHYLAAKDILHRHGALLAPQEARQLYSPLINFCIRRFNAGKESMIRELFHLYREMEQRNLLLLEGKMNAWEFKSAFMAAILSGEIAWAEAFLQDFCSAIPVGFQETMQPFCRGVLAFYQKEFEAAEASMNRVLELFEDPFFGLDARSYLLKIYFHSQNLPGMESLTTSFRLYIRRNKQLSPKRLQNYQRFIRFYRRLMGIGPFEKKKANKLKREVEASPFHPNNRWLIEQLNQILGIPQNSETAAIPAQSED